MCGPSPSSLFPLTVSHVLPIYQLSAINLSSLSTTYIFPLPPSAPYILTPLTPPYVPLSVVSLTFPLHIIPSLSCMVILLCSPSLSHPPLFPPSLHCSHSLIAVSPLLCSDPEAKWFLQGEWKHRKTPSPFFNNYWWVSCQEACVCVCLQLQLALLLAPSHALLIFCLPLHASFLSHSSRLMREPFICTLLFTTLKHGSRVFCVMCFCSDGVCFTYSWYKCVFRIYKCARVCLFHNFYACQGWNEVSVYCRSSEAFTSGTHITCAVEFIK